MVKTYLKTFPRMFKRHATRLVSIVLMILVSIGFCAGIGMAKDKMDGALDDIYSGANVPDLLVKSTREEGFRKEELSLLEQCYGEDNVLCGSSLEFRDGGLIAESETGMFPGYGTQIEVSFPELEKGVTRVYFFDMPPSDLVINRLEVLETAPRPETVEEDAIPLFTERATEQFAEYPLGSVFHAEVTYVVGTPLGVPIVQTSELTFYVAGRVFNPMHFATRDDVSIQFQKGNGDQALLSGVFYLFESDYAPPTNDVYVTLRRPNDDQGTEVLSNGYCASVEKEQEALRALFTQNGESTAEVLTLSENFSFSSFHEYAERIAGIGYVMMVVFLAVTLLIVLSTMARLLEEERGQIACLSTLGYSPAAIVLKYLLFALVGTLIGALGGYFAGMGLSYIVYINFDWCYTLPPFPLQTSTLFFAIVASVIVICTLAATFFAGLRKTRERPASLLRPKAPKPGKKVILERIPLLWERFTFKYKSSLRNVLRYKMRFAMTVVAVTASTALVFAGLAVLDCCIFQNIGTSAMIGVGVVVVLFAALLNFVVIYTLTNINISERNRELATLMVLGYRDREVTSYVFREIYLTGSIGIVLGLPTGCLLCLFIFHVMTFGSIAGIHWFVWLLAPLLSLFFTFLVTLMLSPKILKIHMNESLKAIE